MIWLICAIGGLTALFFLIQVWTKWTAEAVDAGVYCTQMPEEEEEDFDHLWEQGTCLTCRKQKEIYIPEKECQACLISYFVNQPELDGDQDELAVENQRYNSLEMRYHLLQEENARLYQEVSDLQAQVKFLGSNPFGD
jgi:hypothetical protein